MEREIHPDLKPAEKTCRISVSLPESVFRTLDAMVDEQGFDSRSQAIAEMISARRAELDQEVGSQVMAGTITLFYDMSKGSVRKELLQLQQLHIDEVISSQSVLLKNNHILEVLVVQGPAPKLKEIANQFITRKGVRTGKLTLASQIMPPIHPLPEEEEDQGDAVPRIMTPTSPEAILYSQTIRGGGMWSKIISRGKTLRLTDMEGGANVSMLLYHAHERTERYNMPDTLKGQHIFFLTAPYCLHSDMGRVFLFYHRGYEWLARYCVRMHQRRNRS